MTELTERQKLLAEIRRLRGELDAIISAALNGSDDVDDETEEEDPSVPQFHWRPLNWVPGNGYVPTGYGKTPSYYTCTKCGVEKPLDKEHFHLNSHSLTGFATQCKECRLQDHSIWQTKRMKHIRSVVTKRLMGWRPKEISAKRYSRVIIQSLLDAGYEVVKSDQYKQSELPYDDDDGDV